MKYVESHYYIGTYNGQVFIFMCIGGASSSDDEKQFVIPGTSRIFTLDEIEITKEVDLGKK